MINRYVRSTKRHVSRYLNFIEYLLILASTVTGCVSISVFASLVGFHVVIGDSVVASVVSEITKYKSFIKKKRKTHNKIAFWGKAKLDTIEFSTSKVW